ncbi:MAG: hypothetical protein ACJAXZ_004615 [Akkermansiaceae bacterium]|jgi:hypothetical protein
MSRHEWHLQVCFLVLGLQTSGPSAIVRMKVTITDSDRDGLSDKHENDNLTDPENPDTDRDGVWDGMETATGTDPKAVDADPGPTGTPSTGSGPLVDPQFTPSVTLQRSVLLLKPMARIIQPHPKDLPPPTHALPSRHADKFDAPPQSHSCGARRSRSCPSRSARFRRGNILMPRKLLNNTEGSEVFWTGAYATCSNGVSRLAEPANQ